MSVTQQLNKIYAPLLHKLGKFAVSPYSIAYEFSSHIEDSLLDIDFEASDTLMEHPISVGVCVALSVFPVLPAFMALTLSMAILSTFMAMAAALIAYPTGLAYDIITYTTCSA